MKLLTIDVTVSVDVAVGVVVGDTIRPASDSAVYITVYAGNGASRGLDHGALPIRSDGDSCSGHPERESIEMRADGIQASRYRLQ